jgi:hypothetical protein
MCKRPSVAKLTVAKAALCLIIASRMEVASGVKVRVVMNKRTIVLISANHTEDPNIEFSVIAMTSFLNISNIFAETICNASMLIVLSSITF